MRTIAIEEHYLADSFREAMQEEAASKRGGAGLPAPLQAKLEDLDTTRLQDMDAGGIDLQVLSHTVTDIEAFSAEKDERLAREANDQVAAAIAAHPTRFAGFATLPLLNPHVAADELERAVRSLGLKGAMINGTIKGRFLDDPSFLPIFEQAVALNVPIYLHPGIPPAPVRETYYSGLGHALRLILAGIFDRFPGLQIIIGHMGEMIPFMLERVNNVFSPLTTQLQRSIPEYFAQNFYITTSGFFSSPPLLLAMQIMGTDRIMFSVDYPFSTNEQGRVFLESVSLSPADKEKISHANAERLLQLSKAEH